MIWITGISGAGKSSVARALLPLLHEARQCPVLLDGDAVRAAIADPYCGHSRADRLVNAYRMARLSGMLADQGLWVVTATMSLFHEIHAWNRAHLPGYVEVLLAASLATVRARDPKGLYRDVDAGLEGNLPGVDLDLELPRSPELVLDNDGHRVSPVDLARRILDHLGGGGR